MKKVFKKRQYKLIFVAVIVVIAVVYLLPFGNDILHLIRSANKYKIKYGQEVIYPLIDSGDIDVANEILKNKYILSRFDAVEIKNLTWKEDPYNDIYWRFNFYNLEPARNLLYAWIRTGDIAYKNKLIEITQSFIDKGMNGPYSWDYHGTAFRTMTLIDIREKLKQNNALTEDFDKKILSALKVHGDFLADESHFEKDYNHGLDQSVALYLLSVNYPDMPAAKSWLTISSNRISEMMSRIVDDDGVLVENSPYYHLYVLEKVWDIEKYLEKHNLKINGVSEDKLNKMISYVVYMLQPDLSVPTIGASLRRDIALASPYKEMSDTHPELLYALTMGAKGKKPSNLNVRYPTGGQTIMRSGWGQGKDFLDQTQVIFDVGDYRTNHSDLDALSFNLFGAGIPLMPDAGLYTYEPGLYRTYFHGTRSHNTVVVDGKDQSVGGSTKKVFPGFFEEGDGYVYQSGEHELYDGVKHQRSIILIEKSTVIILDALESKDEHTYEQMFHLFPGAKISVEGLTLRALGTTTEQSLTINQYITKDVKLQTVINDKDPLDGICSFEYKKIIPCYSVSYSQKGKNVSFITSINIGSASSTVSVSSDQKYIVVKTLNNTYNIKINKTEGQKRVIEANKKFDISKIYSSLVPADLLNLYSDWTILRDPYEPVNDGKIISNVTENSLEIITPSDGSPLDVSRNVNIDLSDKNIYFKIKIDKTKNLKGLDVSLSNGNWSKQTILYAKNATYDVSRDGEWLQFRLKKGDLRKIELGNWFKTDSTFDWSKIDSIKFTAESNKGESVHIYIKDFYFVPDQASGRAVIIFDDGWSTVMDAAKIMNKYNLKGNVAIITNSIDKKQYLTLEEVKNLQNEDGWNIVNHSSLHKDAVLTYVNDNNLEGYETDIVDGLQYLIQNNINSAPNWYIYPDGRTDGHIKNIIGKYYKFARSTIDFPEAFPYAEPLEIGVFPVYSDRTEPIDIHNAINDAVKYNQTIFLMFHKFSKGKPAMYTEYSLEDFETIIKDIKDQGIKVVTLSELDNENKIPQTEFVIHDAKPGQFDLDISSKSIHVTKENGIVNSWLKLIKLR